MEFYIEVAGEKSWTNKLWDLLTAHTQSVKKQIGRGRYVEVMGPPVWYKLGQDGRILS